MGVTGIITVNGARSDLPIGLNQILGEEK